MERQYVFALFITGLICSFVGFSIADKKGSGTAGFLLGFLLGPIGVLIAAFLDGRTNCPTCGSKLNGKPRLCSGCKTRFEWDGSSFRFFPPKD